jgi:4-oxalocrotonate tautomerase
MISGNMRFGRPDQQKRRLASSLLRVVSEATGEQVNGIFLVVREGGESNPVEGGSQLPKVMEKARGDEALTSLLK